jgi:hypothetical protein
MRKGTFMTKFAVTLDEPSADAFWLSGFVKCVGKGTRDPRGTGAHLEEFAGNMG